MLGMSMGQASQYAMGERFTALPSNHPLGHYFDALHLTGYYYTFIGVGQLMAALLLLIPRTALLGAILYFPIILNICVLAYAVRFRRNSHRHADAIGEPVLAGLGL